MVAASSAWMKTNLIWVDVGVGVGDRVAVGVGVRVGSKARVAQCG